MDFGSLDLTKLSESDLIESNRRIVERLQLLRSTNSLVQLARFSVGMIVEFETDNGRTISGTVARLNQRTATVVTAAGRWRVSPSLLRAAAGPPGYRDAIGPRCFAATATEVEIVRRKYRSCRNPVSRCWFSARDVARNFVLVERPLTEARNRGRSLANAASSRAASAKFISFSPIK